MRETTYTIKDPLGIHARPAGLFVKKLCEFSSFITIFRGEDACDGKHLLPLMKMRVKAGDTITVQALGPDEEAAAAAAAAFLAEHL